MFFLFFAGCIDALEKKWDVSMFFYFFARRDVSMIPMKINKHWCVSKIRFPKDVSMFIIFLQESLTRWKKNETCQCFSYFLQDALTRWKKMRRVNVFLFLQDTLTRWKKNETYQCLLFFCRNHWRVGKKMRRVNVFLFLQESLMRLSSRHLFRLASLFAPLRSCSTP